MGQPVRKTSLDGVSSAQTGESRRTLAHSVIGLYVRVTNFDPGGSDTLEVRVEGSRFQDEDFAPLHRGAPRVLDAISLTASDLVESDENSGVYVGSISGNNMAIESVRANLVEFTAADSNAEVTATIFLTGNTGSGKKYREPSVMGG